MKRSRPFWTSLRSVDWPMVLVTAWIVVTGAVLTGSLMSGLLHR